LLLLGIAPAIASADGRHVRHRPIKKPGHFGKFVQNYHLDDALEARSRDRNGSVNTSRVIVELKPGHQLPNEFKNYLRRFAVDGNADGVDHNLDLINGVLLELPNNLLKKLSSKGEIFRVHLANRGNDPAEFELSVLAKGTKGWNGAEIEQCVVAAMVEAYAAGRKLTRNDIYDQMGKIVPLSTTMSEQIKAIRSWAHDRAIKAGR